MEQHTHKILLGKINLRDKVANLKAVFEVFFYWGMESEIRELLSTQ